MRELKGLLAVGLLVAGCGAPRGQFTGPEPAKVAPADTQEARKAAWEGARVHWDDDAYRVGSTETLYNERTIGTYVKGDAEAEEELDNGGKRVTGMVFMIVGLIELLGGSIAITADNPGAGIGLTAASIPMFVVSLILSVSADGDYEDAAEIYN